MFTRKARTLKPLELRAGVGDIPLMRMTEDIFAKYVEIILDCVTNILLAWGY